MSERRSLVISITTRAVVAVLLVSAGGFIMWWMIDTKPAPPAPRTDSMLRQVRVLKTVEVPVRRQWGGFGSAEAMDTADVPSEVAAVVLAIDDSIVPGNRVVQGDVLVTLDATDYEQQLDLILQRIADIDAQVEQIDIEEVSVRRRLELATGEVELAQADLDRVAGLLVDGGALQPEVDRARRGLKLLQRAETLAQEEKDKISPRRLRLAAQKGALNVETRIAQRNIGRCTITTPISGVIEAIDVELGEQVMPGQRVVRVVNLERIEVPLRLKASARQFVQVGDGVVMNPTGATRSRWTGEVMRISPDDDPGTRTFAVFVEVTQDPGRRDLLTPGVHVAGTVSSTVVADRLVVPRRSLAGQRVLLVEDGVLTERNLEVDFYVNLRFPQLGLDGEDYWAVLGSGIEPGALVVLDTTSDVPLGAPVEAIVMNDGAKTGAMATDGRGRGGR